jgi:RNA polymerase sigma-70 factor (sigma-E family)
MEAPEMEAGTEPLRALFERQYRPMVRLAELLLADRASAEDVTQEAFARLYVRFDRLWDPEAAGAYLRVMVVNLARSALRRRLVALRYLQREPSREPSVGDVAGATADHEAAISALRHLPRRQRECLVLRYYLDQPEAEIATTLGISSGSVKTHTSRGLATMAKLLGGEAA